MTAQMATTIAKTRTLTKVKGIHPLDDRTRTDRYLAR